MKFGWHQDSGYVKHYDPTTRHKPYVTVWCTLDDVSEENGTVYLLPHSRGGTKDRLLDHYREDGTNDVIGYDGDDPGEAMIVPAGSVVAFTSYNLHRSGPNTTDRMRAMPTSAVQRRADPSTRWQALGDGCAVYQGWEDRLQSCRRHRREVRSLSQVELASRSSDWITAWQKA